MSRKSLMPYLRLTLILALGAWGILACQTRLIYFPHHYEASEIHDWATRHHGQVLSYQTSQGQQQAYLQGNLSSPRHLWIVCAGNGSLALNWADWLALYAPTEDAYLLMDYPSYGNCAGKPDPTTIRESHRVVIPQACKQLGWQEVDPKKLRFFGHSLGAACTLLAASEFHIQKGVLLAPFTSTMDMAKVMTKLPLGPFVTHRYDNHARIGEIATGDACIELIHGTNDRVIPCQMSQQLHQSYPQHTRYREITGGDHNGIVDKEPTSLANAMKRVSER